MGSPGQTGTSVGDPSCGDGGGYNGCAVADYVGTSYGTAFNSVGGGVYATLWTSSAIQIWYWARKDIPADITNGTPNPSGWGTPAANFAGCAFDTYFKNMQIVSAVRGRSSCGYEEEIADACFFFGAIDLRYDFLRCLGGSRLAAELLRDGGFKLHGLRSEESAGVCRWVLAC